MGYTTYIRLGRMVLLLVIQLMVLNHMHIFGYATPLLIGYMLICCRQTGSKISLMLWGFATGFIFDLFSNTMGMASASMTLLAAVQPYLLKYFMPIDDTGNFRPNIRNMKIGNYSLYVLSCMGVLHLAFYLLEAFSLSKFWLTLLAVIVGTLVSSIIVVLTELIANDKKQD